MSCLHTRLCKQFPKHVLPGACMFACEQLPFAQMWRYQFPNICCLHDWWTSAYSKPLLNWMFQGCCSARLPPAGDGIAPAASRRPPGALG